MANIRTFIDAIDLVSISNHESLDLGQAIMLDISLETSSQVQNGELDLVRYLA
jgi:hypothetical protein